MPDYGVNATIHPKLNTNTALYTLVDDPAHWHLEMRYRLGVLLEYTVAFYLSRVAVMLDLLKPMFAIVR